MVSGKRLAMATDREKNVSLCPCRGPQLRVEDKPEDRELLWVQMAFWRILQEVCDISWWRDVTPYIRMAYRNSATWR